MKFWRGKREAAKEAVRQIETSNSSEKATPSEDANEPVAQSVPETAETSNVVAITSSKLSDRLAAAGLKGISAPANDAIETLEPLAQDKFPGQERAVELFASAARRRHPGSHILVLGQPGTGRHAVVEHVLLEERNKLARPADWLYLYEPGRQLRAYSLAHGQGKLFAREVHAAIERAGQAIERMLASDDYKLAVEVIDEEFRHRNDKALEDLKRRAESQNIALVKTAEGFMLAPMHEGKVVRSEVFRALPDSLQREVEAKIAGLETELGSYASLFVQRHLEHGEKLTALERETAARAVKPQFDAVRAAFGESGELLSALEAAVVHAASLRMRKMSLGEGAGTPVRVIAAQAASDFAETAPVVVVRELSQSSLNGESSLDHDGRISLCPGTLMRANGGFLVIDAWRLAAQPEAWATISAALETREIRPRLSPNVAMEADPIPANLRVVLIAEPQTLAKLQQIDPGIMKHFPVAVRFEASATTALVDSTTYGRLAARLAKSDGLRPLAGGTAEVLHKDAARRAGKPDSVAIDHNALRSLLAEADRIAADAGQDIIRASDVDNAIRELQTGGAP